MTAHPIANRLETIRFKQPWLVLGAANTFSLACPENPTISHCYSFEASDSEAPTIAIPDGCVEVLFDCGNSDASAKVYGTPMSAMDTGIQSGHRYFGVRFVSGAIPACMQASAEEIVNHQFNFVDVVPHAHQLVENIINSNDFCDQVACFKRFFDKTTARPLSQLTQSMVSIIVARKGNVRIDELALATGYTTRTLQRQFRADIGMSPKAFSRIVRCQSAVYCINHCDDVDFLDMACTLGYSDQSHFLREFKKCVQVTPMAYQKQVKQQSYLDRIQFF